MNMLDFAMDVARKAGREILMKNLSVGITDREIGFKGPRDMVTEIDRASERYIVSRIRDLFPDHAIYAEEETRTEGNEYTWIIDPLDGTVNYAHGHPFFCISMALQHEGETRLGVVFAPYLDELFIAEKGGGAYLNSRSIRLRVSDTRKMEEALLATGFAYRRTATRYNNLENFNRLTVQSLGMRRCGAAAMDLCYVACGRYDGYWELFLQPYDVAAGALIIQEAGGRVTDLKGGDDYIYGQNIVASNGHIHGAIIESLAPFEEAETS